MRSLFGADPWLQMASSRSRRSTQAFVGRRWIWLLGHAYFASSALAQPRDERAALELAVSAPPDGDCIQQAELSARVAERLGQEVVSEPGSTQKVRLVLARAESGTGWKALLSAQAAPSAPRERRIDSSSASCRDLDAALVLVLAALVGVARPGEGLETEATPAPAPPESAPEAPGVPEQPPSADRSDFDAERLARARASRPGHPLSWSVAAAGALASGQLPGFSWGASVPLQIEWRSLTVSLGVLAFPAASAPLGLGAEARFTSVAGLLRMCGTVLPGTWLRAALCMGASSGAVYARTTGLAQNTADWLPSSSGELGLRTSGRMARKIRWLVQFSGTLPLTRMRYVFDESGPERRVYHRAAPGVLLEIGAIIGGSS
jgi:hypothetical protein